MNVNAGYAHAGILIAVVVVTIGAIVRYGSRPSERRMVVAVVIACFAALASAILGTHLCDAGRPWSQWIVPCVCVFLALSFVRAVGLRWILGIVFAGLAVALSIHYVDLVHRRGWAGPPRPSTAAISKMKQQKTREMIQEAATGDESFAAEAGWLRERLPSSSDLHAWLADAPDVVTRVPRWHTWLTGLTELRREPGDYWFPGGNLLEADPLWEIRPRDPAEWQ